MIEPDQVKCNKYAVASASILDTSTLYAALGWAIEDHIKAAQKGGLDGIELWPQRIRPLLQIRSGRISDFEREGVLSAHQSTRPKRPIRTLFDLQYTGCLPENLASLDDLDKVRVHIGQVPLVLFPETPKSYFATLQPSQGRIQTTIEVCEAWGAQDASQFLDVVQKSGLQPLIDTHHIRRHNALTGARNPLSCWQESFPTLLPASDELHIGVGRADYGSLDPALIQAELFDLLNGGTRNTELIQMLRFISQTGWRGLVVLEMRPNFIKDALSLSGLQLSRKELINIYNGIRETLYLIFEK